MKSSRYIENLVDRPTIRNRCHGLLSKDINVCIAIPVRILLLTFLQPSRNSSSKYFIPFYSPNLASCDYNLFGSLKEDLKGR